MTEKGKREYQKYSESVEKSRDEVSRMLLTHLYLENLLERYISTKVKKSDRLFGKNGLSFIQKLNLAWSFNQLSDQEYDSISKINSIRNDFAHTFGYEIEYKTVEELGRTLGKTYKEIESNSDDKDELLCRVLARVCGKLAALVSGEEESET